MSAVVFLLVWAASARWAYVIHKSWWRNQCDFTRNERAFAVPYAVVAGPLALVVAGVLWLMDSAVVSNGDEVLEPRKRT